MIDSILSKYLKNFTKRSHGNFSSKHIVQAVSQELRMRISVSLIALCIFIFSVGCQATPVDTEAPLDNISSPVAPPNQGESSQMTTPPSTFTSPGLESLIEKAKEDLAQRLSISVTQVSLVESIEVEWSDSSLDCLQPGMDYLQVITPGYRIVLEAGGQAYEYHSNRDAYVIYCENPIPPNLPKP
jgi:hypothetical protein